MTAQVYEVEMDTLSGFITFEALERAMVLAAQEDGMEVAAEYLDTLFMHQAQADELAEKYHNRTDSMLEDDEGIRKAQEVVNAAIIEVKNWAREHEHDVAEWFNGGDDDAGD